MQFSKNSLGKSGAFAPLPVGGDEENRTPDPLLARQVLSQLSYAPISRLYLFRPFMNFGFPIPMPTNRILSPMKESSFCRSGKLSFRLPLRKRRFGGPKWT